MWKDLSFGRAAIGFMIGFSLIFAFCRKNMETASGAGSGGMNGNLTVSYLQQSIWRVNYLNDNGTDKTAELNGYDLTFKNDGTMKASKAGASTEGKWSYKWDDDQYKLIFDFGDAQPLRELNNDWEILNSSTSSIKLQDVSGGGGTDYLTLVAK